MHSKYIVCLACFFRDHPMANCSLGSMGKRITSSLSSSLLQLIVFVWFVFKVLLWVCLRSTPHPGFQSPPGLWNIFRIGNPNLNLHLPRASILGGGVDPKTGPLFPIFQSTSHFQGVMFFLANDPTAGANGATNGLCGIREYYGCDLITLDGQKIRREGLAAKDENSWNEINDLIFCFFGQMDFATNP